MPYKAFCDRCEKEVQWNTVSRRAIIDFEGWRAEIMLCNPHGTWNDGVLCEDCLKLMLRGGCFSQKTGAIVKEQRT